MKVVLDTNIFVSGIFWKGESNEIICLWKDGKFVLATSADLLREIITVLNDFKIRLPEEILDGWIELIVKNSIIVNPEKKFKVVEDDPTDDMFIDVAVASDADYLVTQDKHLLKVGGFMSVKIVTPSEFLKIIGSA